MRNLFLLPKPNFKWLLSFCLVALLSFSSNSLLAQPSAFTISGCSAGANGNYTRSSTDVNSCACYENSTGGVLYYQSGFGGSWLSTTGSCANRGNSFTGVYNASGCDISNATAQSCDPATSLSFPPPPAAPASIPTLSEWGLIILALMFMTMGTLYLVQPNMQEKLERS